MLVPGILKTQVDEARDAENVEHRERAEEEPRQNQEHELASLEQRVLIESGQSLEIVLLGGETRAVRGGHDRALCRSAFPSIPRQA